MQPFIRPDEFSSKHFGTNVHILLGALRRRNVHIDAELVDTPYVAISIVARDGNMLTIKAGKGKYASVTLLGALADSTGERQFRNEGEWRAVIAAFFAPFWENPEGHETVAFLKANEGAMVTLLSK
jgi:hypothetical protein